MFSNALSLFGAALFPMAFNIYVLQKQKEIPSEVWRQAYKAQLAIQLSNKENIYFLAK